ncbi:MAG: DUF5684 domain-containing protein [Coriobacteriales bacterium]|nr:DUF5684 domain-containing protein [Coriobacteriales bacterium]
MTEQTTGMATAAGVIGGMLATMAIFWLVFVVLIIIAHWKMFTKAGEAGWKSIIPIYSDFVLFDLVWDVKNFGIYIALVIATSLFSTLSVNQQTGETNVFMSILCLVAAVACLVWYVRLQLKTAAAFGKGTGFAVGLILLPNIFALILGFGSAQYIGKQE